MGNCRPTQIRQFGAMTATPPDKLTWKANKPQKGSKRKKQVYGLTASNTTHKVEPKCIKHGDNNADNNETG